MSKFFCDAGSTLLIGGPAKVDLVADDAPVSATRPTPTITSLTPNTVAKGGADLPVSVTGTNFSQFTKVRFGGVDQPTTYVDPTHVSCVVTAAQSAAAGTIVVSTRNGNKVSGNSNFTVT